MINTITWTVSGKIDKITRTNGSTKPDLEFAYDAQGNRIRKIVKPSGSLSTPTLWTTTDYVLDLQFIFLAVVNGERNVTLDCTIDFITLHLGLGGGFRSITFKHSLRSQTVTLKNYL